MRTFALVLACLALATATATQYIVGPAKLQGAPYAPWAHAHWVWLSSNQSNQTAVEQFVAEFFAHNITVGAVDIDSAWSTGINNFIVDTDKYPDMKGMIDSMHSKDVKVIFWTTSMVDTTSSNYDYGLNHSYYIKNALNEDSTLHWWHGNGQLLDYTNPDAVEWWHSQLDNVLDMGIDGWKTDGTGPFIMEYIVPHASTGPISFRDYENLYYGDFFNYTRQKNGEHCLIMSRPVDSYPLLDGALSAYLVFSPRYVVFSGWVGDEDPNFTGLVNAMRNMLHSAWHNFPNFGSDIGGYRTGPGALGRTAELFIRWFQMGAFVPLMENGGDKEHRPWAFDKPGSTFVVDLYRTFVAAHLELGPYLLATGSAAFFKGVSSITPMQPKPKDLPLLQFNDFKTYAYMLGEQIFVSPITEANVTSVEVDLPAGSWYEFFTPTITHAGDQNITFATPLQAFPVFHSMGSLLPLNVTNDLLGHMSGHNGGGVTFLLHTPQVVADPSDNLVEVHQWQDSGIVAGYEFKPSGSATCDTTGTLTVTVSATSVPVSLLVQNVEAQATSTVKSAGAYEFTSGVASSGVKEMVLHFGQPTLGVAASITDVFVPCVGKQL